MLLLIKSQNLTLVFKLRNHSHSYTVLERIHFLIVLATTVFASGGLNMYEVEFSAFIDSKMGEQIEKSDT